ncbi:hypothetical protein PENANT_c012G01696 [Penicillium antarcticum]|uniref:Major facilitator superfamily (MFS) profile domain-containing protein n=1 Tax=Penicillium antarcticum TaxID=416450 RepID=A0A1V6Q608_9EURO|nr:hypothetical protein PENANT_c012G01696 [Penicillium antarcticum]
MDTKATPDVEKSISSSKLSPADNHDVAHAHVVLIPKPSTHPRDPLSWCQHRKHMILAVLCLASFAGAIAPLSGQLNLADQEKLYNKSKIEESYANSAALAGMAAGPFFFAPIAHRLGRSSVIFWCVACTTVCQIWGAVMTNPKNYIPYVMSRLFAGFFGAVPTVLGPRIVTDLFFLHQRGRAFTVLHMAFLFGTIAGPTFSGFVSAHSFFPVEFWWTVGLLGFTLLCCFFFLEETGFDRLCPATIIMGTFTLISFGFYVGVNALTPVWLQKPVSAGGHNRRPILRPLPQRLSTLLPGTALQQRSLEARV